MNWRRFNLLIATLMLVIALVRLATGNLIGAIIPLVLAALSYTSATNYPLLERLRQIWRLLGGRRDRGE